MLQLADLPHAPATTPLPPYTVYLSAGDSQGERPSDAVERIRIDGVLSLLLRPAEPVIGEVIVRLFLARPGANFMPWAVVLNA